MNAPYHVDTDYKSSLRYKIDGVPCVGNTTVVAVLPKDLTWWASGMACGKFGWINPKKNSLEDVLLSAKSALAYLRNLTDEQYVDHVQSAYKAHNVRKTDAADKGTEAHAWMEVYVKAKIAKTKEFQALPTDPDVLNAVNLFLKFCSEHEIEWLHCEMVVGSKAHMFAGRFDAIARVDGVVCLIDFKTSSGIYYDYFVQAAGYQIAYEEMIECGCFNVPMPKIESRLILRVPKTGNEFEAMTALTPYAMDKQQFLACLTTYHNLKAAEKMMKAAA